MSNETIKRVLKSYTALRVVGEMVSNESATIDGHNVAGARIVFIFIEADKRWTEFTEAMHLLATEVSA